MTKNTRLLAALLLAACSMPAFAQEPGKPATITLQSKSGSVMTSAGGDYQSADAGKPLVVGESMMLMDGAQATVVYAYEGGRTCSEAYKGPNTYVIDDMCTKAAAVIGSKGNIATVAGVALIAAVLTGSGSSDFVPPPPPPPPPVSGN